MKLYGLRKPNGMLFSVQAATVTDFDTKENSVSIEPRYISISTALIVGDFHGQPTFATTDRELAQSLITHGHGNERQYIINLKLPANVRADELEIVEFWAPDK